jgi:hypothetical protein
MTEEELIKKYSSDLLTDDQTEQPVAVAEEPATMTAGQVAGSAIMNLPGSLYQLGADVVGAALSPIETAKTVLDLGAGALQEALPEGVVQAIGEDPESRELARQVGQMYVDRYGSVEKAKRTFASDPAGFLGDVSTLFGVGGATVPGRVGASLSRAAAVTEPTALAVKGAAKVASKAVPITAGALGVTTGVGDAPIREAFEAGREGGERGEMLTTQMRGQGDPLVVIDAAKQGLTQMRRSMMQRYRSQMQEVGKAQEPIRMRPIYDIAEAAMERATFGREITDANAARAIAAVQDKVMQWAKLDPAIYHTAEGIDALKRSVGAIIDNIPMEQRNARAAVQSIYDQIRSEISAQAPIYSDAMKDYSQAAELITEIERTLSLNPKATVDTQLRKLQSVMRDNVQTNYGQRTRLAEQLEMSGGVPFRAGLAGQALQPYAPRGAARFGVGPLTLQQAASGNIPVAATMAAGSSPRLVGETAYRAGQVAGIGQDIAGGARSAGQQIPLGLLNMITDPLTRSILFQAGRAQGL